MAQNKFNLTVGNAAFEACTRRVIQPGHINMLPVEYHHFPQFFLPPQGEDEADDYVQVLNCIMMEDGLHGLATFRDFERYRMPDNSDKESEVPEDDSDEEFEMEDEDEVPIKLLTFPHQEDHDMLLIKVIYTNTI